MSTFDILKTKYERKNPSSESHLIYMIIGGVAGTFSVTLTYPTDLVRRRIQLSATDGYR